MNRNKLTILQSFILLFTFLVAWYGHGIVRNYFSISFPNNYLATAWFYAWWVIPATFAAGFLFGFRRLMATMGLHKGFIRGLLFSALAVAPMFLGSALTGRFNTDLQAWDMIKASLLPGFFEEYLFRGFLFGLLFRKVGWGFIPAGLAGAVFFGLAHIYQGTSPAQTLGIFLVTAMGALWFAWLYIEWNNNLWVPIFLHTFMNLSWALFDISENALGGVYANIFRIVTIAATVLITIFYNRPRELTIHKKVLLWNRNTEQ